MKKGTLIAIGVFAVLLLVVFATREKQVSVGVERLAVPELDKSKVTGLEISGAKSSSLKKEGEEWVVFDPKKPEQKYAADKSQVDSALEAVRAFKAEDFVTEKSERHAEFELDDSKGLKLKVLADGVKFPELVLGKSAKSGGTYVRLADKPSVFVAKGQLPWTVRKDVGGWRKRAIVTTKLEDLTDVTIQHAAGDVLSVVAKDGSWALKEGTATPAGYRFDPNLARTFAQSFTALTTQEFLDPGTMDDDALGFAGSHDVLEATTKDGKKVVVHLGLQSESTQPSLATQLKTSFAALDVAEKDQKLTLDELKKAAQDKAKPEELKKALARATTDAAFFNRLDLGGYAGGTKDGALTETELDGAARTLSLVPVRVEGDPQVYLAPSYGVGQVRKKLNDMRDLSLLAFDVTRAQKLSIDVGGKKTVVAKEGGAWKIVAPKTVPTGFEFDASQVDAQLHTLRNMRATRLVPGADDAKAGVAKPVAQIEVALDDGSKHTVRFGKELTAEGGAKEHYATGTVDRLIYAVSAYERTRLDSGVELFKKPEPPPSFGNSGIQGLESLPPDVRRKLEAQLRQQ